MKINIDNVSKEFNGKEILKDISLKIDGSESIAIIGGSGCGKSVLIKHILGLLKPTSGRILIDDKDINNIKEHEKTEIMSKIGMLFQGGALFDSLSVWENICFFLINHRGMGKKDAQDLAVETLKKVGLKPEVALLYPSELSGGMQKRVALARAIVLKPELILFDEPTTGLDPIMTDVISELIKKCSEELGATTITITHDMGSARKVASKIYMMYQGNFVWQGTAGELDTTDNPYIRQFVEGKSEGPIKI